MTMFSCANHVRDKQIRSVILRLLALVSLLALAACGGHSSGASHRESHRNGYSVGGTITGLTTSGLILRNNGADDLTVAANAGTFQFATPIAAGGGYDVTVFAQPAGLTCTINSGVGSNVNTDINTIRIACSAVTFTVGGTITGLTGSGLVLQNNNGDDLTVAANAATFEFATPVAYGGNYAVTVLTQPSGQACNLTSASGTATAQVGDVVLACAQTVLTTSVSRMALAIANTTLNAALSGTSRQITITNTGVIAATNLLVTYPVWPTGTTTSSTCGSALAASASCTITITPGMVATSTCNTGVVPTPDTISISADDAPDSTVDVTVLGYGCIYQGGYVFAIDDTTPATASIGGKVAALTDQASSIEWSSDGNAGADFTSILGIDETSTTSMPSPTNPTYPVGTPAYGACNGSIDGACNTANIVSYYNVNRTSGGSAPTPLLQYAAGDCIATINGYSDWYLPAICEEGYGSAAACGTSSAPTLQNMQSSLVDSGVVALSGVYWSATEASVIPSQAAWIQVFATGGGSNQGLDLKSEAYSTRCIRALTQ